jgi:phenylpropionate dioxygenase-like ring-hydroxylating dioxygenase large terminal subunit
MSAPTDKTVPYAGYFLRDVPAPDTELTAVSAGSPTGEFMRRFWQPVCLSSELNDLPKAVRILGEDLVAFRSRSGVIGILHRHCSHRGTSLEYGIVADRGIRCCYHGWLFGIDGRILETPGEPPGSRVGESVVHGAYPAHEHAGLVFVYMGPEPTPPPFPRLDTLETPNDRLVPFSIRHSCNWLQVLENFVDPIHTVFLHSDYAEIQLSEAYAEMPELDWREVEGGLICVSSRRLDGDRAWIRVNHLLLPNFVQVGTLIEDGEPKLFSRAGITRWIVPFDETNCAIVGWRHFNSDVPSLMLGDPDACGVERMDAVGQTGHRTYEEKQRNPGDWDVLVSQRPVAVHALEHLGSTDRGVVLLRRLLRMAVRGERNVPSPLHSADRVDTLTQDTVVSVDIPQTGERAFLRDLGHRVSEAARTPPGLRATARNETVRARISEIASGRP